MDEHLELASCLPSWTRTRAETTTELIPRVLPELAFSFRFVFLDFKSETGKVNSVAAGIFFPLNVELSSSVAWSHGRRGAALACTEAWMMIISTD
jgi:hypothetical protein